MPSNEIRVAIEQCFDNPDSPDALTGLHKALHAPLMAILLSIRPEFADDAYQSAFVRFILLFRSGRRPDVDYEAYFVAIAKNSLIDEIRRQQRFVPFDRVFDEELPDSGDEMAQAELRVVLLQALTQLDTRCRFLIESFYIRGSSSGELAEHIGVAADSIYVLIQRCRDRLRKIWNS